MTTRLCRSRFLAGEAGGAGDGLPCAWWADDGHPGTAAFLLPPGAASEHGDPELPVPGTAGRTGVGPSRCPRLRLLPHHYSAEILPHRTVLLHDVRGRENIQAGDAL